MAGRPQQRRIDYQAIELDARAAYIERNNELRSRLRSIEVSLTGLSRRRWEHVIEVLMSAWAHTTTTKTAKATTRLTATSGLSADQYRRARRAALELGMLAAVRSYAGDKRQADRLDVDVGTVDDFVRESQVLKRQKLRPTAPQLPPTAPHIKEEYMRASKDLPKNITTTSTAAKKTNAEAEVEIFLRKVREKLPAPLRLADAVRAALAAGCSLDQLRERAAWFGNHLRHWPSEHRPGVLYVGLAECGPDMPVDAGWPYRMVRT